MNRIQSLFERKKNGILSIYFTAGYPHLDQTEEIITELESHGIDLIEIGIPFSDPMADGPVIQQSGTAALNNGMTIKKLFSQLKDIRTKVSIPLIMMGYLNPIMRYGFERFCKDCVSVGIDGIIIPDLPFADYMADYKPVADKHDLRMIMLITPETSEDRIRLIDSNTSGFIYMVSTASTTGTKDSFDEKTLEYFRRIDSMNLRNPRLIGFGISNKATLDAAQANASGAIIGSGFIKSLGVSATVRDGVENLIAKLK